MPPEHYVQSRQKDAVARLQLGFEFAQKFPGEFFIVICVLHF